MTSPVPVHLTLEAILEVLQQNRDNADVFYAQQLIDNTSILTALSGINALVDTFRTEFNAFAAMETDIGLQNQQWLELISSQSDTIIATLETLNSNAALNAQNQQNILLGNASVCCDVISPGFGLPDDMCQKAQDMINIVFARMDEIANIEWGTTLPTVAQIVDIFTFQGDNGVVQSFLSNADATAVLAALAVLGVGNISEIGTVVDTVGVRDVILDVLGTANSASEAVAEVRTLDPEGFGVSPSAVKAVFAAFGLSMVNHLWDDPPTFDGSGYDDICGGEPVEGTGYLPEGASIPTAADNFDPVVINSSMDMDRGGAGNLSPHPWPAGVGDTVYWTVCYNTTPAFSSTVYITTSDSDFGTLISQCEPGIVTSFVMPNDRFLALWAHPRLFDDPPAEVAIVFAWNSGDTTDHCPV